MRETERRTMLVLDVNVKQIIQCVIEGKVNSKEGAMWLLGVHPHPGGTVN